MCACCCTPQCIFQFGGYRGHTLNVLHVVSAASYAVAHHVLASKTAVNRCIIARQVAHPGLIVLQFYARGLFTSPMLTGISWQSAAINKPLFMLWRVILSIHGMIDYPVRHLSGGD